MSAGLTTEVGPFLRVQACGPHDTLQCKESAGDTRACRLSAVPSTCVLEPGTRVGDGWHWKGPGLFRACLWAGFVNIQMVSSLCRCYPGRPRFARKTARVSLLPCFPFWLYLKSSSPNSMHSFSRVARMRLPHSTNAKSGDSVGQREQCS